MVPERGVKILKSRCYILWTRSDNNYVMTTHKWTILIIKIPNNAYHLVPVLFFYRSSKFGFSHRICITENVHTQAFPRLSEKDILC